MAAGFQDYNIPQLEEGDLEEATDSEAIDEIERLMQEEKGRLEEAAADFRYEREKSEEGFRYVPDSNYGVFNTEEAEEVDEDIFEIETELDFGKDILYDGENQKMELDMGWNSEREIYQVITEPQNVFQSSESPVMFRNEKGNLEGIIEWYPDQGDILMKNCKGEMENWKGANNYREEKKLQLFRTLRREKNKFMSAVEGDDWVLQNGESSAQQARECLIDNLCPMLKDKGRVDADNGIKRLGENGPKHGDLVNQFAQALNRFEMKVRNVYEMDPDKIEVKQNNDEIVYKE
jgi:hypothetical protein